MSSPAAETPAPEQKFSYKKAMNCLTDPEKARMLAVFITILDRAKPTPAELKLAAAQHGSAEGGFAKSFSNHMKKLRENACYIIEGEDLAAIPTPEGTPAAKKTPAKRKAATPAVDAEAGDEPATPAKKARGRPKKTAAKVKEEAGDETEIGAKADSKEPTPTPVAADE